MTQNSFTADQDQPDLNKSRFQIRIRDLFFLMVIAAFLALAFASKWTTDVMFLLALCFGLFVVVVFVSTISRDKNVAVLASFLLVVSVVLALLGCVSAATIVFLHFIAAAVLQLSRLRPSPKMLTGISLACLATAMLFLNGIKPSRLHKLQQAQIKYPIMNLSDRLNYEADFDEKNGPTNSEPVLSKQIALRLSEKESMPAENYLGRRKALHRIHDKSYEEFVRSIGFGAVRMMTVSTRRIDIPEIPLIRFDDEYVTDETDKWDNWNRRLRIFDEQAQVADPKDFHESGEQDFLHPETLGFIKSPKNAAGFLPHAFHLPRNGLYDQKIEYKVWGLERLELISLLRFDEPRAYVLDHLPRMDHLSNDDIPTRLLNDFESAALMRLESETDIVVEQSDTGVLRMLGSLRANKNCAECHSVNRGELLGAFTYEFARIER